MGLKDAFTKHLIWPRPKRTKANKSSGESLEMPLANTLEPAAQPEMALQPSPAVEAVLGREPTLEGPAQGEREASPVPSEERIQVKQVTPMTEAVGSTSQADPPVPPAPEQAPQQGAQPQNTRSVSAISDDLRQLFEEVQTGNEELKKLAQSLEDVDIRSLAKECSVVATRLKSRWGNR